MAGQELQAVGAAPVLPSLCCGGAESAGDWGTPELHLLPHPPRQWASLQPSMCCPAGLASQQGLGGLQLGVLPERGGEPHRHRAAENKDTVGGTKNLSVSLRLCQNFLSQEASFLQAGCLWSLQVLTTQVQTFSSMGRIPVTPSPRSNRGRGTASLLFSYSPASHLTPSPRGYKGHKQGSNSC